MRLSLAGSAGKPEAEVRDIAAGVLRDHRIDLDFSVVEIGAVPLEQEPEPFYILPHFFPRSRIHAFELDAAVCERLNAKGTLGVQYYPEALAGANGRRRVYETVHPMCSSLYAPQAFWSDTFHDLDVMRLKSTAEIEVRTLDDFARDHGVTRIDLMKMDVQGAVDWAHRSFDADKNTRTLGKKSPAHASMERKLAQIAIRSAAPRPQPYPSRSSP